MVNNRTRGHSRNATIQHTRTTRQSNNNVSTRALDVPTDHSNDAQEEGASMTGVSVVAGDMSTSDSQGSTLTDEQQHSAVVEMDRQDQKNYRTGRKSDLVRKVIHIANTIIWYKFKFPYGDGCPTNHKKMDEYLRQELHLSEEEFTQKRPEFKAAFTRAIRNKRSYATSQMMQVFLGKICFIGSKSGLFDLNDSSFWIE